MMESILILFECKHFQQLKAKQYMTIALLWDYILSVNPRNYNYRITSHTKNVATSIIDCHAVRMAMYGSFI